MRLLPRTVGETWVLAAVVWLAGCGVLWWQLPLRPRATWSVNENAELVGFVPGTRMIVTRTNAEPTGRHEPLARGPLQFWNVEDGRENSWFDADTGIDLTALSPDGRWLAVTIHGKDGAPARLRILEYPTQQQRIDLPLGDSASGYVGVFSGDGRRFAFADDSGGTPRVRIWDIEEQREYMTVPEIDPPWAFSPDGRYFAHTQRSFNERHHIRILDLRASSLVRQLETPPIRACEHLSFSPDGRSLVAGLTAFNEKESRVQCWDVAGGRLKLDRAGFAKFPPRANWAVFSEDVDGNGTIDVLTCWDYDSGHECGRVAHDSHAITVSEEVSPDGRILVAGAAVQNPAVAWLTRISGRWVSLGATRELEMRHTLTGRSIGELPLPTSDNVWDYAMGNVQTAFTSDCGMLAVLDGSRLEVWDIPPTKSLTRTWLPIALLTLVFGVLVRWQVRHLRRSPPARLAHRASASLDRKEPVP